MLGLNGLMLSSSEGCGSVWGYFIVHGELELHIEKKSNTRNPLRDGAGSFHQVFRDSVCLRLFEHQGVF